MKNISELNAYSHGQIATALQIIRIMKKKGLCIEDLESYKKYAIKAHQMGIKRDGPCEGCGDRKKEKRVKTQRGGKRYAL